MASNANFPYPQGGSEDTISSYNLDNDNYLSFGAGLEDDSPSDDEEGGSGVRYACVPKGFMKSCCGDTPQAAEARKGFGGEGSGLKNETLLEKRLIKERGVQYVGNKSTVTMVQQNPRYDEFRKEEERLKEARVEAVNVDIGVPAHNHIGEVSSCTD